MTLAYSTTLRNNKLQKIIDAIDSGSAGHLKIYSGTRPATGGSVTTLLADFVLPGPPCAPAPSSGVLTFNAISNVNASSTGTASWARITDSAGTFVADMDVTATGGGGDVQLNTTSLVNGVAVSITSATITAGNP